MRMMDDKIVFANEHCEHFEKRISAFIPVKDECWFCKFAKFNLNKPSLSGAGMCTFNLESEKLYCKE